MSGFQPAEYIFAVKAVNEDAGVFKPKVSWISNGMNSDYYLHCIRPDTQRKNEDMFKAFISFPPFNETSRAEADKAEPVLSNLLAPEIR